jgi:hypothetical protein
MLMPKLAIASPSRLRERRRDARSRHRHPKANKLALRGIIEDAPRTF